MFINYMHVSTVLCVQAAKIQSGCKYPLYSVYSYRSLVREKFGKFGKFSMIYQTRTIQIVLTIDNLLGDLAIHSPNAGLKRVNLLNFFLPYFPTINYTYTSTKCPSYSLSKTQPSLRRHTKFRSSKHIQKCTIIVCLRL